MHKASTLMHPIEAMNHRKSGFFPTDFDTVSLIMQRLIPNDKGINLLDPCCGCGEALREFKQLYPNAQTFGVEVEFERYEVAKEYLDNAYYADINDISLGRGHFDFLFLNPPYGNDMADNLTGEKTIRLEHKFLTLTVPALKADGILVYVVPKASIDEKRITWLLARFKNITIQKAAVDTYKQIIVMGTKLKQQRSVNNKMKAQLQTQLSNMPSLLQVEASQYEVPTSTHHAKIRVNRLNEINVAEAIKKYPGQWMHFGSLFANKLANNFHRPIHELSQWHLALLITSGAVQGEVVSKDGKQKLLVKGTVRKFKKISQTTNEDTSGNVTTEIESRDQFSAQIKAIDVTPNSKRFGDIITIR